MALSEKYQSRLSDLEKALAGLSTHMVVNENEFDESMQDLIHNGQVQKFEYCLELLWKTIKLYLYEAEGIDETTPKSVIKAFYRESKLPAMVFEDLILAVNHRNYLAHVYSEEQFNAIHSHIHMHLQSMQLALGLLQGFGTN